MRILGHGVLCRGNLASYIKLHGRVEEQLTRNFIGQFGNYNWLIFQLNPFVAGTGLKVLNTHHIVHRVLNQELLQNICSSTCLLFSELVLTHLPPYCVDICSRLLCVNPGKRFSFDEFYHHEFLRTWLESESYS